MVIEGRSELQLLLARGPSASAFALLPLRLMHRSTNPTTPLLISNSDLHFFLLFPLVYFTTLSVSRDDFDGSSSIQIYLRAPAKSSKIRNAQQIIRKSSKRGL
jgi:hypothetical protein